MVGSLTLPCMAAIRKVWYAHFNESSFTGYKLALTVVWAQLKRCAAAERLGGGAVLCSRRRQE